MSLRLALGGDAGFYLRGLFLLSLPLGAVQPFRRLPVG